MWHGGRAISSIFSALLDIEAGSKLNFEIERSQKKINLEIITMDRNDFYLKPKYY